MGLAQVRALPAARGTVSSAHPAIGNSCFYAPEYFEAITATPGLLERVRLVAPNVSIQGGDSTGRAPSG